MCGICGQLTFDEDATVSPLLIRNMTETIRHRGPDDEGFYVSGQMGLGFRRLSIIDLDGGHQPMSNENETVWVVFNGEIYNYKSLRYELINKGHTFKTDSDTEVIVHLYEEHGVECIGRLRGMFALALWDSDQKTLILARDRVGIKPLYYFRTHRHLTFASELKAILSDPSIPREIDLNIVDRSLAYRYLPGRQTLVKNLFKLEPGHVLVAKRGKCETRRYWDLDFTKPDYQRTDSECERELLALLNETVQLHMISDVPVGFLLSGGIDSTALLSLAAQRAVNPISTFTVGFSGAKVVDERPFARLAAKTFGCTHSELSISPKEFAAFMPGYVWHMEEPVCEPPAIALYYVSKMASQSVKVLMSGEGGDEAFAGYENYRNILWFERIKNMMPPIHCVLAPWVRSLGRMSDSRVLRKYGARLDVPFEEYYLSRSSSPFEYFPRERLNLYSDDFAQCIDSNQSIAVTREYLARAKGYSLLDKMLYVDSNTWLPDDLLTKADKMTMANSVELRVPLLDHKILEFAASLPSHLKIRRWTMKYLFKKVLKQRIPDKILTRRKAGFPVPYESWLQNDLGTWVADILLDRKTLNRGYFKRSAIEGLLRESFKRSNHGKELFSLVILELWHRVFIDLSPAISPDSMG